MPGGHVYRGSGADSCTECCVHVRHVNVVRVRLYAVSVHDCYSV